jgi:hypothetical protein
MLRPFRADPALCDDGDMSGPLLFAFALGSCHLLARGARTRAHSTHEHARALGLLRVRRRDPPAVLTRA